MNILRKTSYILLIFVALGGVFITIPQSYAQTRADEFRQQVIEGINIARRTAGIPQLAVNEALTFAAQVTIEFGYDVGTIVPETIERILVGRGYIHGNLWYTLSPPTQTAPQAIALLFNDPEQRAELLSDRYGDIGVGYIENTLGESGVMVLLGMRGEIVLPTQMPPACTNPIPPYRISGQDLTAPSDSRAPQLKILTDIYDSLAQNWLNSATVPGAVIGLIDNGTFVWAKAYGHTNSRTYAPMTVDTVFDVASFSKSITAAIVLQLMEQGVISLNMPVFDVVTAWQPVTEYDLYGVNPYRLLSHTAGFPTANYPLFRDNFSPIPTLIETLNGIGYRRRAPVTLTQPPGTTFAYSNSGYSVLQLFIESITRESFADYARCSILLPLGMTMSDFYLRPDMQEAHAMGHDVRGTPLGRFLLTPALAPAGLHSTLPDFARWVVALLAPPATPNVLSASSIRMMMTPAQHTEGQYGLGLYITDWQGESTPYHTADSNGYTAYFQLLPSKRHGIIVLTNSENGERFYNRVVGQWQQWLKSTGEIVGISSDEAERQRQANIQQLLVLINEERATAELEPLFANTLVMQDAQANSQMMAARDDVEWHELWGFANRMQSLNYGFEYYYYWGAYGMQIDAQATFNIWKQRTAEFDRIFMNADTTEIGLGLATSGSGINYYAVIVVDR